MADVIVGGNGNTTELKRWDQLGDDLVISLALDLPGTVQAVYGGGTPSSGQIAQIPVTQLSMAVETANAYTLAGVTFVQAGKVHRVKSGGEIQVDLNSISGVGSAVGTLLADKLSMDVWGAGTDPAISSFRGLAAPPVTGPFSPFGGFQVMFRTAVAPLRTGALNILGTLRDGTTFNVTADDDGIINAARVKGRVNYNTGVVDMFFVSPVATVPGQLQTDIGYLQIPGVGNVFLDQARTESLRYSAVAFTYLPLNSDLLGIDPVRLPSDGRVPIFAPSYLLVFGRTERLAPRIYSNGAIENVGQTRLSHLRLIDANDQVINTGYTVDLDAGTLAVASTAGWAQPVRPEWRIEDMTQCRDAQINGDVTFLPALSHDYPADGHSYCSSALAFGDLVARVSHLFDLQTFDATFSDTAGAGAPTAQYDDVNAPIEVTNSGAVTERWALLFSSTTQFRVLGQHLGQIDIGTIGEDCAPVNPNTGVPYFVIPKEGWGLGWSTGNTLRFNTVACGHAAWVIRTVRQGPPAGEDYSFELLPRGGVDNPL